MASEGSHRFQHSWIYGMFQRCYVNKLLNTKKSFFVISVNFLSKPISNIAFGCFFK